jgi:hypothetical protein
LKKIVFFYAGIGIAVVNLTESTVRVTIRHSDSEPIASEAATVRINRDEATGIERALKPAAPGDRIMAEILQVAGESPTTPQNFAAIAGNIGAAGIRKMAK